MRKIETHEDLCQWFINYYNLSSVDDIMDLNYDDLYDFACSMYELYKRNR